MNILERAVGLPILDRFVQLGFIVLRQILGVLDTLHQIGILALEVRVHCTLRCSVNLALCLEELAQVFIYSSMARISGIDLPKNKRGEIGLTYIYGIGRATAQYILDKAGINFDKKVNQWNDDELNAIRNIITNELKVEGQLRSEVQMSIKRLLDIACYRGLRHRKGLPVRGQRTRTNSRTRKGKRKTVAGKKKAPKK